MDLVKEHRCLEDAVVLITSRPCACKKLNAGRSIEVVGFGKDEIKRFAKESFPNDENSVEEFMKQLGKYPQLYSLSYVPMNVSMVVSIFHRHEKLPSTLTDLYCQFIVMVLNKKRGAGLSGITVDQRTVDILSEMLPCLSKDCKETIGTVFFLSRLAYYGYFDCNNGRGKQSRGPKIIFTKQDLIAVKNFIQPYVQILDEFDGLGLLRTEHMYQLPMDVSTYNFTHLTIQEFFAALYISVLPLEEQLCLLSRWFHNYPSVFIFLCGLKGLSCKQMFNFVHSKLSSALYKPAMTMFDHDVVTAVKCIYKSKLESPSMTSPVQFNIGHNILLPYECLCSSYVLSCFSISQLNIGSCHIGNKGAEMLVKHYPNKNTTDPVLEALRIDANNLTIEGFTHVMKIADTCE